MTARPAVGEKGQEAPAAQAAPQQVALGARRAQVQVAHPPAAEEADPVRAVPLPAPGLVGSPALVVA
ncbi:MAG: hypothetical protein KC766_09330, partial [Myxococcales bacterium]|nr:hypothetical protein [Myxococcales bacterium]